jgi:hypothetical protein
MVGANRQAAQMNSAAGVALRSVRDGLRPPMDGPMGNVIRDEQGAAIQEMMTWSAANPNAGTTEFQATTQAILQRSRARAWERIAPNLPHPEGYGGGRDALELPEIDRLEREAVQQR